MVWLRYSLPMSPWSPVELELAEIPSALAETRGVEPIGTVVWHVAPAPYATVECVRVGDNPDRLKTELIDIPLNDLQPVET